MADGRTGFGGTLEFLTDAWTGEITKFDFSEPTREAHDVTHHGTPLEAGEGYASKQYLPSKLIDWGELSVEFLWNPNNPPPKGKAKQTIRYTYPLEDGEATPAKEEFSGFITSGPSKSIPVDGVMTAKMTIKICSKPVETEAT